MRKPFWFTQKQCWYVKDRSGRAIRLDPDEEEAYRLWQSMRDAASELRHPKVTIGRLVEAWLSDYAIVASEKRLNWAGHFLGRFVDRLGAQTPALEITVPMIVEWVNSETRTFKRKPPRPWSQATRHDAANVVKRVYSWAHAEGHIQRNPLARMRISAGKSRACTISDEDHRKLIEACRSQKANGKEFALYLMASKCGARPKQIREVTAANVHASGKCWVFTDHKTSESAGKPLVVYLNPCLQTLTRMLVRQHPRGPLFRQENGRPWSKDTVVRRLARLREKCGLGDTAVAYAYRHTFATNALLAGVPLATVSTLLGHCDTRMVSQVYGHLDQHAEHLVEAAAKAHQRQV